MKEGEREEARLWLEKLIHLYENNKAAISEVTNLKLESTAEDWDRTFSNENVRALASAISPIKGLPKPKNKELRKLKNYYTDLVATCLKAGHLYLKSYYDKELSRMRYSQMIFWTSASERLLKDFLKNLELVRQQIQGE